MTSDFDACNVIESEIFRDFIEITDPEYGNCYTYNHDGSKITGRGGAQYGNF